MHGNLPSSPAENALAGANPGSWDEPPPWGGFPGNFLAREELSTHAAIDASRSNMDMFTARTTAVIRWSYFASPMRCPWPCKESQVSRGRESSVRTEGGTGASARSGTTGARSTNASWVMTASAPSRYTHASPCS